MAPKTAQDAPDPPGGSEPPSVEEIVADARKRLSGRTRRPGQRVGLIWAGVSEDKGQTPEGQVAELLDAADRMGLFVPPEFVFVFEGQSRYIGKVPPQKREVLQLAQKRRFDVLLTWKLDRWSRDRKAGAKEVYEILPACGVTVVSLQESFLTTEGVPAFWREKIGEIILWLAEQDSTAKSERTKLRYRANRNRAAAGGGKAKWGRGRIPTLDERARVLELDAKGESQWGIHRETGIPRTTVQRILADHLAQSSAPEGARSSSQVDE